MAPTNIIVRGRIPSKKNSKRPFIRAGRMMIFSSKAYVNWHKQALKQLPSFEFPINEARVLITLFAPDKRKSDLSNKCESIMDLLVDGGIIEDDNWFVVPELVMKFGGVDKNNPRAEILLT